MSDPALNVYVPAHVFDGPLAVGDVVTLPDGRVANLQPLDLQPQAAAESVDCALPPDPWKHRSTRMRCGNCMWFVAKVDDEGQPLPLGRCRKRAPTLDGYPPVFDTDWCGDHKLDEQPRPQARHRGLPPADKPAEGGGETAERGELQTGLCRNESANPCAIARRDGDGSDRTEVPAGTSRTFFLSSQFVLLANNQQCVESEGPDGLVVTVLDKPTKQ